MKSDLWNKLLMIKIIIIYFIISIFMKIHQKRDELKLFWFLNYGGNYYPIPEDMIPPLKEPPKFDPFWVANDWRPSAARDELSYAELDPGSPITEPVPVPMSFIFFWSFTALVFFDIIEPSLLSWGLIFLFCFIFSVISVCFSRIESLRVSSYFCCSRSYSRSLYF